MFRREILLFSRASARESLKTGFHLLGVSVVTLGNDTDLKEGVIDNLEVGAIIGLPPNELGGLRHDGSGGREHAREGNNDGW